MLVLGRKTDEIVHIEPNWYVQFQGISNRGAQLSAWRLGDERNAVTAHVDYCHSWHVISGVEISYQGHRGGQARLGFKGPKCILIDRLEIHRRKQAERASATQCAA